jgi:hypothetical protein
MLIVWSKVNTRRQGAPVPLATETESGVRIGDIVCSALQGVREFFGPRWEALPPN